MKLKQGCSICLFLLFTLLVYAHSSSILNFGKRPKYIHPWPVDVALGTGIAHAIKGKCNATSTYTIRSVRDLFMGIAELECIYVAGKAPSSIPLGPYYGTVLKASTSDTWTPIAAQMWKGKLAIETRCPKLLSMVLNFVNNRLRIAAELSIGTPKLKLAEGEYNDGQPALILDYTKDFNSMCTTPNGSFYGNKDISLDLLNNVFPFHQIVDVVRVVGRQPDNGVIYLGKSYLLDPYSLDTPTFNIAYWSFVNYDDRVSKLKHGESLSPLPITFEYMEPGIFQAVKQLTPFDNLLTDPHSVLESFFEYFDAFAKIIISNYGADINRGVTRAKIVVSSHIEFLIGAISALCTSHPSLAGGLTAQGFAETLLIGTQDRSSNDKQKSFGEVIMSKYSIPKAFNNIRNILYQSKPSESLLVGAQNQKNKNATEAAAMNSMRTTLLQLAEELRDAAFEDGSGEMNDAVEPPPMASDSSFVAETPMLKK